MGNPTKGTPAYVKKLLANKARRAKNRKAAFNKKPQVKTLVKKTLTDVRASCVEQVKAKAIEIKRVMEAKVAIKEEQVLQLKKQLVEEKKANASFKLENDVLKRVAKKEELFWGWVRAHGNPGTIKWLERLRARGPPRSRDAGWGGGQ